MGFRKGSNDDMCMWSIRTLWLAVIVTISGCAVFDDIGTALSPGVAAVPAATARSGDVTPPEIRPSAARHARTGTVPLPKRKPDLVDPKTLVGLDKAAVSVLFGAPHRVTTAEPATVWAWETGGCRMRLFFYPDVSATTQRALTYEISADSEKFNALLVDTCASRLKWAHAETSR